MILIRPVQNKDLKGLYELAAHLNSVNLPHHKKKLQTLIRVSQASFEGRWQEWTSQKFLFVAEEMETGSIVACSAVFSQHGTPQRPHLYFQAHYETQKSHYLGKTVRRKYYTLHQKKKGPSEMACLVVHPEYRMRPEKIGLQISFARYLYVWKHPEKFKREFLSELNGVIRPDGGSDLWDTLGAKLTGLDYRTADQLSQVSKEFILKLYPKTRFYFDLLPKKAQAVIERNGPESEGAMRLLQKIGYRYLKQCCPFDGGPFFGAKWKEIKLFKKMKEGELEVGKTSKKQGLVACDNKKGIHLILSDYIYKNGKIKIPQESMERLSMGKQQNKGWVLPI